MKHAYLALAIAGTVLPLAAFAPWVVSEGANVEKFIGAMFANRVASFFALDVLVSAIVVFALALDGHRRGVRSTWLAVVGTCLVGVSLGLPLYLFLEARQREV